MNNVVDVFAGVNDSFFKTVNGEILGCGSDGNWQLMLEDAEKTDLFPPAKTTIPNNVTFCILGNSKSVVFFGVEPPPNIPNRNVDFSKLVIRPNIQFQQLTNQKATPRKIVNKPKSQLQQNTQQTDKSILVIHSADQKVNFNKTKGKFLQDDQ